jgi:peptidoglycan hydrolase CwlO-like protein
MLRLSLPRLVALVAALACLPLALWAASPLVGEGAQTPESLQKSIDGRKARERSLASSAQKLAGLEQALARDVAVLQGRLGSVQADLAGEEARLGTTQVNLRGERARAQRLADRLAHGKRLLARRLREQYTASEPDLVTIVLSAQNLPDLLEQTEFLRRIQRSDQRIVSDVRDARDASRAQTRKLASLEVRQRDTVLAVRRRQSALQTMNAALASRQSALAQAKAARLASLHSTRAGRLKAQSELRHLLAEREQAATSSAGPGGPWSIPWAIVQCESGGQNLPPNSAGASGYYQFMPATWQGLGGSTPNAYQASKAEQDRLAATLWAGGSGADNWDCAALVAA